MCKCQQKKKFQALRAQSATAKVKVSCEDCETALMTMSGFPVPVNITTVDVSKQQYNAWVAQGHPVKLV